MSQKHENKPSEQASFASSPCSVPRQLLEDLLYNTYELKAERNWWKDEIRCNYQRDYQAYCDAIEACEKILKNSQNEIIC